MKKKYISPELEIINLETSDVITTSVPGAESGGDTGGWDDWT